MSTIGLHYAEIVPKIWAVNNTSCVLLGQIGSIMLQKEILFWKIDIAFVYILCPIMPKKSQKNSHRVNHETRGWIVLAKIR